MKNHYLKLIIIVSVSLLINGCVRRHSTYENSPPSYVKQKTCDAKCKEAEAIKQEVATTKDEIEILASKITLHTGAPFSGRNVITRYECTNRVDVTVDCSSEAAYKKKSYVASQEKFIDITNGNSFPIACSGKVDHEPTPFKAKISSGEKREFTVTDHSTNYANADAISAIVYCSFDYKGKQAKVKLQFAITGNVLRDITYNGESWQLVYAREK